ncbi:MAG: hypothetical protein ACXWHZ_02660 [Usitatibacter sp.]
MKKLAKIVIWVGLCGLLAIQIMHVLSHLFRPSLVAGADPPSSFPVVVLASSGDDSRKQLFYIRWAKLPEFKSKHPDATFQIGDRSGELDPYPNVHINYRSTPIPSGYHVAVDYRDSDYRDYGEYEVNGESVKAVYYRGEHAMLALISIGVSALVLAFGYALFGKWRKRRSPSVEKLT